MKLSMSTFVFIILVAGIAYLAIFNKPKHPSDAELEKWFSSKLISIADKLENDIEQDKKGAYPHAGKQSFKKRGVIDYILLDKNFSRFDVSDKNPLSRKDIIKTKGYGVLEDKARKLALTIHLKENEVEGDGVDSFNELDEYIDDFPRYYTVTIRGW